MDNFHYFKFSQENNDDILDFSKPQGLLVVNQNEQFDDTPLMEANRKLIDLISEYRNYRTGVDKEILNSTIDDVINVLENTYLINYSPFCVYFQVVGYSYSSYMSDKDSMTIYEKRNIIQQLLDLYIENRHNIYQRLGYSEIILQVQSDASSNRRKGKTGIVKMLDIMSPYGFVRAKQLLDFRRNEYCYLLPDKGDLSLFNRVLKDNGIRFEFRETRDNKNPDLFLKINNDFYILEHKLTNGGGGAQNAEINEIIQFIGYEEEKKNWHYISCLQGDFFKKLNSESKEPKAFSQYQNIINNLTLHSGNFFLNGKGFERFINDLCEKPNIYNRILKFNNSF